MNFWNYRPEPIIGQAWSGRHVVILRCTLDNQFIHVYTSSQAPMEPVHSSCAESLSRFLSIGYRIVAITTLPLQQIQYLLVQP